MTSPAWLAARCAEALPVQVALGATGAPHRAYEQAGPIALADLGTGTQWGVQAVDARPGATPADRAAALRWCVARGASGFLVSVPAPDPAWDGLGLVEVDRLPALATTAAVAAALAGPHPQGFEVGPPRDLAELLEAYGGWMDDHALARLLVVDADLERPERAFLVGRVAGRPVGCAFVWFAAGTAYLSGIGVVAAERGKGYGAALTAAAARLGAAGPVGGLAPSVVWMHASEQGVPVYRRLGFEPAGEEVRLTLPPT